MKKDIWMLEKSVRAALAAYARPLEAYARPRPSLGGSGITIMERNQPILPDNPECSKYGR